MTIYRSIGSNSRASPKLGEFCVFWVLGLNVLNSGLLADLLRRADSYNSYNMPSRSSFYSMTFLRYSWLLIRNIGCVFSFILQLKINLNLKFRNIGFANELPLLGLANRLMAIKDEDKAIEAIMQCLDESRIKTDESKKISIIANYR